MANHQQMRSSQAALVIFSATIGTLYLPLAGMIVPYTETASWWVTIVTFVAASAWVPLVAWLAKSAPTNNFHKAAIYWLGPIAGRIFLFWFALYWLLLASGLLAEISLVFHAIALPDTPVKVLAITSFLLILYTDFRGFQAGMRTIQMLLFLSAPLGAIFLISAAVVTNLDNLEPLLGVGLKDILKTVSLVSPYPLIGVLLTLYLALKVQDQKKIAKYSTLSIWGAGLILAIIVGLTLGVLGCSNTKVFFYPTVPLALSIGIGDILQGIELVVYPLWLLSAFTIVAVAFSLASATTKDALPSLPPAYCTLGLGVIMLTSALFQSNVYIVTHFLNIICYYMSLPFYAVLLIAALVTKYRKKV